MQSNCAASGFRAAFFPRIFVHGCVFVGLLIGACLHASATEALIAQWQSSASERGLHRYGVWEALLHIQGGRPQIDDTRFLLSHGAQSVEAELHATLAYLYGPHADAAVCRFPARYLWLQKELNLPVLSLAHCERLQEFIRRAPAERISLVFASENLSQPSSMMGHLFMKVQGRRSDGISVSHAIAFFTDADTFNLPKLFYDSMVVGKQGFFVLTPFQDEAQLYAIDEQRSLWEYELKLDDFTRRLMQAHMHELRQTDITYFFQSYNCATLVKHIVALAAPDMLSGREWWTTPKSVVQRAQAVGLVADRKVTTPSKWHLRAIGDALSPEQVRLVRDQVTRRVLPEAPPVHLDGTPQDEDQRQQGFLTIELARALNSRLLEQKQISRADWRVYVDGLDELRQRHHSDLEISTDPRKDPANAPPERQISVGWQQRAHTQQMRIGLQPVSHALIDDNRHLLGESELRLFDTTILVEPKNGRVQLDRFTLYAVESLLPWSGLTGGLSGSFKIGVEKQAQLSEMDKKAFLTEGAVGYTWRLGADLDAFALIGGGWGYRQRGFLYTAPTVGVLIREVFDMKTVLRLSQVSSPLGQKHSSREMTLSQIKYLNGRNSLLLEWRRTWQAGSSANQGAVVLKHLF